MTTPTVVSLMAESSLPPLPTVAPELLEVHHVARVQGAEALAAADPAASELFRFNGRRRLVESLANLFLDDRQMLLPPRRRHLHQSLADRVGGCRSAFRHIDGRLEMIRRGHIDRVLGPETPFVLNAFAESHDPNAHETNPGLIRLTESGFDEGQNTFKPPDGALCRQLLDGCIDVANNAPLPAVVRAGWLTAAFLAVHPFVDGNGRTARLLFQLVSSSDPKERLDWGTVEQWAVDRNGYVAALVTSQAPSLPTYVGERVDTTPFVEYAIQTSIAGAQLNARRLRWYERAWGSLDGLPAELRAAEVAVVSAGSASLDELSDLAALADPSTCTNAATELVAAGRLVWDRRSLLRPTANNPLLEITAE